MPENAVLRLRRERMALATRPYRARGCRVLRCQRCLLPQIHCLCQTIQPQPANSRFCLIMFDTEPLKPSNTGRLIADILPATQAFIWSRTAPDPGLLALIQNSRYRPYVVFPAAYAKPERLVFTQLPEPTKPALFILLDGTWSEARKMFRKSPYLDSLPLFSLDVTALSDYRLRAAQRPEQHCTAEVAAALLLQAGDRAAASGLRDHFTLFREQYLLSKPHHQKPSVS